MNIIKMYNNNQSYETNKYITNHSCGTIIYKKL